MKRRSDFMREVMLVGTFCLLLLSVTLMSGCETQEEPQHAMIYEGEIDYCTTCNCQEYRCVQECQKCNLFRRG